MLCDVFNMSSTPYVSSLWRVPEMQCAQFHQYLRHALLRTGPLQSVGSKSARASIRLFMDGASPFTAAKCSAVRSHLSFAPRSARASVRLFMDGASPVRLFQPGPHIPAARCSAVRLFQPGVFISARASSRSFIDGESPAPAALCNAWSP